MLLLQHLQVCHGVAIMTYFLYIINNISEFKGWFTVNIETICISILLIYLFNIFISILPLFKVLRKRPTMILAGNEIQ